MFSAIKLSYNNEVRRVTVFETPLTYQVLVETAKRLFPSIPSSSTLSFAWMDDEEDIIQLSSEEELVEALRVLEGINKSSVRFDVILTNESRASPIEENPQIPSTSVHSGVTCDECGTFPIMGVRYKCAIRRDYDLCPVCEAKHIQPYPMVKIYSPEQAPAAIFIAVNEEDCPKASPEGPAHAQEWTFDKPSGQWVPPPPYFMPPFGPPPFGPPPFGPHPHGPPGPHPHGPPGPHPHGPPGPHPHGPPGHGWHPHGHHFRGPWGPGSRRHCGWGRGGRHRECAKDRENWRKFVDETINKGSEFASNVANHVAAALNPNGATEDVERQIMEMALRESVSDQKDKDTVSSGTEESKMSESSVSSSSASSFRSSGGLPEPSAIPVVAAREVVEPMAAPVVTPRNTIPAAAPSDWEVVGNSQMGSPRTNPSASSLPAFAHGFVVPAAAPSTSPPSVPRGPPSDFDVWATELGLLANMGFYDATGNIELLRKFCSPPVSAQAFGAVPKSDGIQRVVNALLS